MTTTTDLLREIAQHIRDEAESLRESHGHFPDRDPGTMETEVREVYERELRYAAALDALADQMERAEPVGWMESPYGAIKANPAYRMSAPQALAWRIPLYTHPAADVQRDAERYRWLREHSREYTLTEKDGYGGRQLRGWEELDAAIDAAMQEPKPC